jgi:CRISPR-associated protein Csx10
VTEEKCFQLVVDIELKAPVLIARTVGDENMVASEDYIPGAVILGALAQLHNGGKPKPGAPDGEFADFFLSNDVRFLNGYPRVEINDEPNMFFRALPVPHSIQYKKSQNAKAEEKFIEEDDRDKLVTFESLLEKADSNNGAPVTTYKSGFCLLREKGEKIEYWEYPVSKQYQFHHKRTDQRSGRSADSEIYNYESIMPHQYFRSMILGPKEKLETLEALIQKNNGRIRIGRSKNTQYGSAHLVCVGAVREYKQEYPSLRNSKGLSDQQFILTLLSDWIPEQHGQMTVAYISREIAQALNDLKVVDHKKELDASKDAITCRNAFFKTDTVEKYNAAWKARTPSQICLTKGSCFVFELSSDLTILDIKQALDRLQIKGVGLRRNEGFGRIAIDWHGNDLCSKELKENEPEKPQSAPESVKSIFQNLFKQWLLDKARAQASKKVSVFDQYNANNNPLNKLSSTQINKLRRMATDAGSNSQFKQKIDKLNTSSKERLQDIRFGEQRFYEFLQSDPVQNFIFPEVATDDKVKALLSVSDFENFQDDPELRNQLFITFYDTLFALLEKSKKKLNKK